MSTSLRSSLQKWLSLPKPGQSPNSRPSKKILSVTWLEVSLTIPFLPVKVYGRVCQHQTQWFTKV